MTPILRKIKSVAEDQAAQAAAEAVEKAKAAAAQEPAKGLPQKWKKSQQAAKKEAKPAARAEAPVKPAQNASGQPVPNQPKRKAVMPGKITPVGPKLRIKASLSRKQLKSSRSLLPARRPGSLRPPRLFKIRRIPTAWFGLRAESSIRGPLT